MMDLNVARYLGVLWRWSWLLIVATALAAGLSYRVSKMIPPTYLTYTTLMVGDTAANPNVTADDIQTSQRLTAAYAEMAQREPILQATVEALHLPMNWWDLQQRVLVTRDGSQFIEIRVSDHDPQRAKAIADEVAHQLLLQSPTAQNQRQLEQRQRFLQQQLDSLQANIQQAQQTLAIKQAQLGKETSARAVLDLEDEIKALDLKITSWQSTYASLLSSSKGKPSNMITIINPAFVPTQPVSPNVKTNMLAAAAAGLLLALGGVAVIEYLDDTVRGVEDASRISTLSVLGAIGHLGWRRKAESKLVAVRKPHSPSAEAYRILRTNVQLELVGDGRRPLLVTSPGLGEGKSVTSANLAVSFAQSGKQTILVDADLRHPSIHTFFGASNERGLTSLLPSAGAVSDGGTENEPVISAAEWTRRVESCLVATNVPGLRVLPSGQSSALNPAELLASPELERWLNVLRNMCDVLILDSPPVLPVADTMILAARGLAVILVVQSGKTRSEAARLAEDILLHTPSRVLGIVLNKAAKATPSYYKYRSSPSMTERPGTRPRPPQSS